MLEEFYKLGALQALEDAGLLEKEAKGRKWQQLMHAVAEGKRNPTSFGKALGVKGRMDAPLVDAISVPRVGEGTAAARAAEHGGSAEAAKRVHRMRGIAKRDYGTFRGDSEVKALLDDARKTLKAKGGEI